MSGTTQFYGVTYPSSTDYVKDGATAIQTVATGFDSAVAIPTYNAQTGATYTFVLADTGKRVTASNASSQTYTIPPTASVAWTANTTLRVLNLGAGVVTFAAGAGVTVTNTAQTLAQYQSANLVRTGLNAWTVTPDSGAASATGLTLISTTTIGTAVSSVTVTGAFSATYDNYKILISGGAASANIDINLQLGASVTGYYYGRSSIIYSSIAVSNFAGNNIASFAGGCGKGESTGLHLTCDLLMPFLAKNTIIASHFIDGQSAGFAGFYAGFHNSAVSYSSLVVTSTGGTMTDGTIKVYGYNN